MGRSVIACVAAPPEGTARPFEGILRGRRIQGVVVTRGGRFYAYENLCRHLAFPLDSPRDGSFLSPHGHLLCIHHGALYETTSGRCIEGPCLGENLRAFTVDVRRGELWICTEETR